MAITRNKAARAPKSARGAKPKKTKKQGPTELKPEEAKYPK